MRKPNKPGGSRRGAKPPLRKSRFSKTELTRRTPDKERDGDQKKDRPSGAKRTNFKDKGPQSKKWDKPETSRRPRKERDSDRSERPTAARRANFKDEHPQPFSKKWDKGETTRRPTRERDSDKPERRTAARRTNFDDERPQPFSKKWDKGETSRRPSKERDRDKKQERSAPAKRTNFREKGSKPFVKWDKSETARRPDDTRKRKPVAKRTDPEPESKPTIIRLNRYIANSGVCSRREADQLITMGLITVNGKSVTELGFKVNPGDSVRYNGKLLRAEKPVYILLNKPKGFLTTTKDPQERDTVMNLVGKAVSERVYPVGRLDRNTTGLLLLTNDGELAEKLSHPSYNVKKIYKVDLDRPLSRADLQRIADGVQLEEGRAIVDDVAIVSDDSKTIGIEIHIGWNRVVRRIFEALEYEVLKLDRSVYAGLDKKDLPRGKWRFLRDEEIIRLKHIRKGR